MITFTQFFKLIVENKFNEVPRSVVGMETSYENFPQNQPYGFWVDRSGNWIEVETTRHQTVAEYMLDTANDWLKAQGMEQFKYWDEYNTLFKAGFMRVAMDKDTVYMEMRSHPTISQERFLEMCKDMYELPYLNKNIRV